ncbi:hypothetical protein MRB53_036225 [Persea americana]|uniref:Uncharacterized protein n=1 Tax=Persea americana TaxID=3435 RepID=A0ACC2K6U9_PERAE|nr:hypothetical protein MRB53_036225 [Persea americana]
MVAVDSFRLSSPPKPTSLRSLPLSPKIYRRRLPPSPSISPLSISPLPSLSIFLLQTHAAAPARRPRLHTVPSSSSSAPTRRLPPVGTLVVS